MAGRWLTAGMLGTLLVVLLVGIQASAQCPRKINDCGIVPDEDETLTTSGALQQIVAYLTPGGGVTATASMLVEGGSLRSGSEATIELQVSNSTAVANGTLVRLSFLNLVGARLAGSQVYEFPYPVAGTKPSGTFDVDVLARSGGAVSIPILLQVTTPDGQVHEDVGVLSAGVSGKGSGAVLGDWLVPATLGLLVGVAMTAIVLRRKP